jgi:hypothetical protein
MNIFDLLLVSVEAGIALAGFAGIIATYQINDVTRIRRGPVGALTVIVQFSLMAALASGISLCMSAFGVTGESLWAVSSMFGAIFIIFGAYNIAKSMKGGITKKSVWVMFLILQGLGALVALVLILNSLNIVFHRQPGPFIAGIIYALGVASYMFSRVLLLPLWRIVKEQESEKATGTSSA